MRMSMRMYMRMRLYMCTYTDKPRSIAALFSGRLYLVNRFELSVCLCLTNYASVHQKVDMGHTYEG